MKEIFSKSENFKQEYSATIVKVGQLKDIENSDNLKQVIIDGFSVVVNKNDVKEGDLMIYCKNETEICNSFLSINNMYEIGHYELNAAHEFIESLINAGKMDTAKENVGYFNKHGRVKMIKLRGCPSMGVLFKFDSFINWDENLKNVNLEDYIKTDENGNFIPFDFDTVNDRLFIKAYVPKTNDVRSTAGTGKKKDKTKKFDRMIPGEFVFHYDTNQLNSNMWRLKPEDVVDISTKVHGTSFVMGNILVKSNTFMNKLKMRYNAWLDNRIRKVNRKIKKADEELVPDLERKAAKIENRKITNFDSEYSDIYSSRTVIKNSNINTGVTSGFYKTDIWGEYNELLKGKIPENVTIYGEIVGYFTGSEQMIQKKYDYSCAKGENKLMIYRVTEKLEDGSHKEYEIYDVMQFIDKLKTMYPDIESRLMPFTLLYHGTLKDLYPDIDVHEHWNENVLERLKQDKEHFGMEMDEPLCKNKVPREGICLRIANDKVKECFKLKCLTFLGKEAAEIDKGNVDIEMLDNYCQ